MFIHAPEPSADTERLYDAVAKSEGFVMNLAKAWAWRPDVFEAFGALRGRLNAGAGLDPVDKATLVCATAAQLGDAYCALAWGGKLATLSGVAPTAALLAGDDSQMPVRQRALAAWARQLVRNPNATAAADVQALREVGLDDKTIFEATCFVAFRLAFSTVNDALGLAPDRQLAEAQPDEIRAAVRFGRTPR